MSDPLGSDYSVQALPAGYAIDQTACGYMYGPLLTALLSPLSRPSERHHTIPTLVPR